jgi:simple sugar transport system permease protein
MGAMGVPLSDSMDAFLDGAFGTEYALAASINRAVIFSAVGLGFIFANQANLTNVGGEGQIAVAGIAAAAVALKTPVTDLPGPLPYLLPMLAGVAASGAWGGSCGVHKVLVGTNEVISSLLLTFIGTWLPYWSTQSVDLLRQPMTNNATLPETLEIPDPTKLPVLFDVAGPLNLGLIIVAVLAVAVGLILRKSAFGVKLRAVGLNELAPVALASPMTAMLFLPWQSRGRSPVSPGQFMLLGEQFVLKDGFPSGYGFDGLVVGLLSRGSAAGVVLGGLFFGFLRSGGINMEMVAKVPSAVVVIIQGLVIIAIAASAFWPTVREKRA